MERYDTVIRGGTVVFPGRGAIECDVGIRDGLIAALASELSAGADEVVDARGLHVFPGGVDAHMHFGIYRDLATDVASETESSLVGGATTALSYFRTGHHYLDRTGPYREILPEVLAATEGNARTDYGYHLAPMTSGQLDEIGWLAGEAGIASFKYFMFYKGLNLAGDSEDSDAFTMSDDKYDFGHLYVMMENIAAADARPGGPGRISLSLHCENAELIKLFMARTQAAGGRGARAWHEARPPLTERLSVHEAAILADATRCPVNLLHLSSAEALRAALEVRGLYPSLDVRCETTLHHLVLTHDMLEGTGGKVNPPIRTRSDVEALWGGVMRGDIDWVASDHACCMESLKGDDLWPALPGFGGTALLYPVMLSEGAHRRGLALERVAELVSTAPARAYGCFPAKGTIAVGADADLVLVDLQREQVVTPELLHSAQDHTPFAGVTLRGWPVRTLLRGATVYRDGEVIGEPAGRFLRRPVVVPEAEAVA